MLANEFLQLREEVGQARDEGMTRELAELLGDDEENYQIGVCWGGNGLTGINLGF